MDKIASPDELQAELRKLLAYAESETPSRGKLASGMRALAGRVAGSDRVAVSLRDQALNREVQDVMGVVLDDYVRKMGKAEFEAVLRAAEWGVFEPEGGDRNRQHSLKVLQNQVVSKVFRIAAKAKHGDEREMPQDAGVWWYDQTHNTQYTMARSLLKYAARRLGFKLDRKKLL